MALCGGGEITRVVIQRVVTVITLFCVYVRPNLVPRPSSPRVKNIIVKINA